MRVGDSWHPVAAAGPWTRRPSEAPRPHQGVAERGIVRPGAPRSRKRESTVSLINVRSITVFVIVGVITRGHKKAFWTGAPAVKPAHLTKGNLLRSTAENKRVVAAKRRHRSAKTPNISGRDGATVILAFRKPALPCPDLQSTPGPPSGRKIARHMFIESTAGRGRPCRGRRPAGEACAPLPPA